MADWDEPDSDAGRDGGRDDPPFDNDDGPPPDHGSGEGHDEGPGDGSGVSWRQSPLARHDADKADEPVAQFEPEQLALGDEDVALPWLEGDDDEDEYEGYGASSIVGLVLLGIAILVLVVGGIWWATRRGSSDGELVADGSVVAAPEQPYKERPADPGGKTFEGTGDTSFAVSQGQTRPAQLGSGEAPAPGFETAGASPSVAAPSPRPSASATAAPTTGETAAPTAPGFGVQVGAYSTRKTAEEGWSRLTSQYDALKGMHYRIVEGQADIGKVFRLQALPGDEAAAKALCKQLKSSGLNCQVKR